jgi:hypothetical protein
MGKRRTLEYFEAEIASPQDLEIFTQRQEFASRGARVVPPLSLSHPIVEILGERETRTFLRDAWGRRHFMFRSPSGAGRFSRYVQSPTLGRLRGRRPFRVVHRAQAVHGGLRLLAQQFADWVGSPTSIDLFLTAPRATEEARWHWDPFDKFLIQLEGSGGIEIYESIGRDLLRGHTTPAFPHHSENTAVKCAEVMRGPGDVLYIPGGTPHRHFYTGGTSVFAPLWITPVTWYDVLSRGIEHALRACENDICFRQRVGSARLDATYFRRLKRAFVENIDDGLLDYCYHSVRIARETAAPNEARAHARSLATLGAHGERCELVRTHRQYYLHRLFGAWELMVHGRKFYVNPPDAANLRVLLERSRIGPQDLEKMKCSRTSVMKLLIDSRLFSAVPIPRTRRASRSEAGA